MYVNPIKKISNEFFGWVYDKYPYLFSATKVNLPKADMKIPVRTYVSLGLSMTTIVYFLVFFIMLFIFLPRDIFIFTKIVYIIFIPTIISVIIFLIYIFYPFIRADARKRSIESNLPFAVAHMGAIAGSGVAPQETFKLLSNFGEYGELTKEMMKISWNIEVFGMDPVSAVKQVAKTTPSDSFREILLGFITTTESGGDVKLYLKNAGKQALFEWRAKRKRFMDQLSTYAEFYTGLLIAAPLFLISLFSVMNMISGQIGGFAILDLMKISIYAVVPLLNGGFLIFLHTTQVEM